MTDPTDAQARERVIDELAAAALIGRAHARRAVMAGWVRPEPLGEETELDIQEALHCADLPGMVLPDSWPHVADVLAAEVRRLRGAR